MPFFRPNRKILLSRKSPASSSEPFPSAPVSNNVNHIVNVAVGLRSIVDAATSLVSLARSEVATARQNIASLQPTLNSSASPAIRPQISEGDVVQEQDRQIKIMQGSLPSFSSTTLNSDIAATVEELVKHSRQTIMPLFRSPVMKIENKMVPDLDSVEMRVRKGKGISDSFFASLTISMTVADIDSGNVASLRIFRSENVSSNLSRPLSDISARGISVIGSRPAISRQKNNDSISALARRLEEDGIPNEISFYNPIDRIIGERVAAKITPLRAISRPIDSSVADDPTFIDARRLQEPDFGLFAYDEMGIAGGNDARGTDVGAAHEDDLSERESKFGLVVQGNNSAKFKQLFVAKPSAFMSKKIGNRYYFNFDDESVVFGRQYQYYVVSVSNEMAQSNRSEIAVINIDGMRVPARPSTVIVSSDGSAATLFINCEDQFVEKYEIWKRDVETSAAKKEFVVFRSENGFAFVDEVNNASDHSGANWVDLNVVPGHSYLYRIYSIDVFGNKSESPFETKIVIPDIFDNDDKSLGKPSLMAEVDSKSQKIKLTIRCSDKNVRRLRLERRDLTIRQKNFTVPSEPARTIMGVNRVKHGIRIESIQDQDNISIWNGWFDNTGDDIIFVDRLTQFDRTYQYRLHGVDDRGNRTSYAYSSPVLVTRRPMINVPVNLSSSFVTGTGGSIVGITLSWQSSSLDKSPEDHLGSQDALSDTSVRTLYQLERQKVGERWLMFNMTSDQTYFDPVEGYSGTLAPEFRPPFLQMNTEYNYRIQAVMSGGFVSNKTQQVSVYVGQGIATPLNFNLKTPSPRVRPFYVMLNWDTASNTGVVDRWEIERVEVNNFAASRINTLNPKDVQKLSFKPFRTIFRESSRFHTFWTDNVSGDFRSEIITGQHHFMDLEIVFGNTYFYRIFAVDTRGNKSTPAYRGIRVTSTPFERLLGEVVSGAERDSLTLRQTPLRPAPAILPASSRDTLSLNPTFSTPRSVPVLRPVSRFTRSRK